MPNTGFILFLNNISVSSGSQHLVRSVVVGNLPLPACGSVVMSFNRAVSLNSHFLRILVHWPPRHRPHLFSRYWIPWVHFQTYGSAQSIFSPDLRLAIALLTILIVELRDREASSMSAVSCATSSHASLLLLVAPTRILPQFRCHQFGTNHTWVVLAQKIDGVLAGFNEQDSRLALLTVRRTPISLLRSLWGEFRRAYGQIQNLIRFMPWWACPRAHRRARSCAADCAGDNAPRRGAHLDATLSQVLHG